MKVNINKNIRGINKNDYLLDSEIGDRTINLSSRNSRQYNVRKRKQNSLEFKIRQVLHIVCAFALVILIGSISIRAISAEEVEIDVLEQLIYEVPEIEDIIKDTEIEESIKSYDEFMKEGDVIHNNRNHITASSKKVQNKPVIIAKEIGTKTIKKLEFSLDRLSYAVSMAETSGYTKGYGVTHNNGHGIKHGNTAPCPGVPKMYMCKFGSRLDSHEAFKKIWSKWYGEFPTYALANKWTGGDRTADWLRIVTFYYQKGK